MPPIRVACPFVPCLAQLTIVPFRPRSDQPERQVMVFPQHVVEGPGSWFQRYCPASMMPALPLTDTDRAKLDAAYLRYQEMREARESGRAWRPGPVWSAPQGVRRAGEMASGLGEAPPESCPLCAADGTERSFAARSDLIAHLAQEHNRDVRADSSRPPGGDVQSFFPVRPAETEQESHGPAAPARRHEGVEMADNRSGLVGMLNLVVQASGEAQDRCAQMTDLTERVNALLEQLAQDHQVAAAMAVSAVGSDTANLPESAQQMLAQASRLGEIIIELRESFSLALIRIDGASRSARALGQAAEQYKGQI